MTLHKGKYNYTMNKTKKQKNFDYWIWSECLHRTETTTMVESLRAKLAETCTRLQSVAF